MIEAKPQNIKPMKINDFMVHVLESTALISRAGQIFFHDYHKKICVAI